MNRIILISLFLFACFHGITQPKTVVYHLTVSDTTVSYTGKMRKAIAINGQIPAPILYFTEGDTAEIHVR
ncbi:MAG: multicopper oxidase domain-containing protein, partial [Tannerella sp.]|nr:multicopper oxidase domain-containing protein [Tannerella sp.]